MKWVLVIFSLTLHMATANNVLADQDAYRVEVEQINRRYENFFVRKQEEKRRDKQRRSGAEMHSKERTREERRREIIRKRFVESRKAEPDRTRARLAWEANQRRLEEEHEEKRQEFIEHRKLLNKLKSSARHIPEDEEYGL